MKTKNLLILGVISFVILFTGCNNDDDMDRWYDSMPDGGLFHTGNALRFFYVDEGGNDLIDPDDFSTLPVSSLELLESQPVIEDFESNQRYNNSYNSILYNKEKGLHEFFTYAFGDSRQSNYTFYVYYKGVADKMDVTFKYQDHKVDGGLYYASNNISWSVNGVEVYNINKPAIIKYVRLVKKSNGTTEVVIEE
ncbi:MAG: hypothetical protein PHR13_11295 [Dysgonamonadaceae bacterium]|nr:hypothetical protein [Dysgonamonadaceae bacterium]MDD3901624.1 hypothetical protein [Dysgonamonadaceae bacterium]